MTAAWLDPVSGQPSCPDCDGAGSFDDGDDCVMCAGTGVATRDAVAGYDTVAVIAAMLIT